MSPEENSSPQTGFTAVPPPLPAPVPPEEPRRDPDPPAEVLPPTPVVLRAEGGAGSVGARTVMAALTADALWLQDTWRLRQIALSALTGIESLAGGKELALTVTSGTSTEWVRLKFAGAATARRWHDELLARREQLLADAAPAGRRVPGGVVLLRGGPGPSQVIVGDVEFTGPSARTADRGLQLRAALRGADAVVWVMRRQYSVRGEAGHVARGVAVRAEDADDRLRLRRRWFGDEARRLATRMFLLLACEVGLLLLVSAFCAGKTVFHEATGETPEQALRSTGLSVGLFFAWPLALVLLLRVLPRPQLLPATGLAVLAATTGRGLTVMAAHVLGVRAGGAAPPGLLGCSLLDPVDWTFIVLGLVFSVRAWRLAGDAPAVLPHDGPAVPITRGAWARSLLAVSGVFTLAMLGLAGKERYQASSYLAQPGIDTRREQEALLAFNRGVGLSDRQEWAAAEGAFRDSLRTWEELTKGPSAPPAYRACLGRTLYGLAWVCHRQGRLDEAEGYYARVVAVGDRLGNGAPSDPEFSRCLEEARRVLGDIQADRLALQLDEKERQGVLKYEEAAVKARQGAEGAVGLYGEAIALWEETLPQRTAPDDRRFAVTRLATTYLQVGELRQREGQRPEAEAALVKSIEYGEEAVRLAPDRPLARHNLELARQMLEDQREQGLLDEVGRLCAADRYADAAEVWSQRVAEQEELLHDGKDREAVARRLAGRLDHFAWFLAHCPDERVRDTKAAVRKARRATELQPDTSGHWYTLALVQYRNRDWRDSLASLEQLKAHSGELTGSGWLLTAMSRHQLGQRPEARAAMQKAAEWIDARKKEAEDNAELRLRYELIRPGFESLRREAESLLEGKDPGERGTG